MLIIALILFGMVAGGVAQMILGTPMREVNWPRAFAAGLIGSFVGGLGASLIAGDGLQLRPSGLIGSIVGALVVSLVWRALDKRKAT